MPKQPSWDKYEVALLIDAYLQIQDGRSKTMVVKHLSAALRKRAKEIGTDVDDVFRNENGITLRMSEIQYLFTHGVKGIPHSSKLFSDMFCLYHNKPHEFNAILHDAQTQLEKGSTTISKRILSNDFQSWLSTQGLTPTWLKQYIKAIDILSKFAIRRRLIKESLWGIQDPHAFSLAYAKISQQHLARITHKDCFAVTDKHVATYKKFLKERSEMGDSFLLSPNSCAQTIESDSQEGNNLTKAKVEASLPNSTSNDVVNPSPSVRKNESVRNSDDEALLEKYPVLYKRVYSTLKSFGDVPVTAENIHQKMDAMARVSTIKRILDQASWSSYKSGKYTFSAEEVIHAPAAQNVDTASSVSHENDFCRWLIEVKELDTLGCARNQAALQKMNHHSQQLFGKSVDIFTLQNTEDVMLMQDRLSKVTPSSEYTESHIRQARSALGLYLSFMASIEEQQNKVQKSQATKAEKEFRKWLVLSETPEEAKKIADGLSRVDPKCKEAGLIATSFFEIGSPREMGQALRCAKQGKLPFVMWREYASYACKGIIKYAEFLQSDSQGKQSARDHKGIERLDFKKIGDMSFTQPRLLFYFGRKSSDFSTWADVYTRFLYLLREDHPRTIVSGIHLSSSEMPDVSSDSASMRAPKSIGKNLFAETNHDTRGLINRMYSALQLCNVSTRNITILYSVKKRSVGSRDKINAQAISKVNAILKRSSNGISLENIKAKVKDLSHRDLLCILNEPFSIRLGPLYFHKDNIEDFDEAADIILESLKKQFNKNGGYTSAKLLYSDVHGRLDDFFFNNGAFESEKEIYDLAQYLFSQVNYNGFKFVFAENKHIWESEPNYPKNYLNILANFARLQNSIATRDEMLTWLENMGSTSTAATFSNMMLSKSQNPSEKVFLMFDEYQYVLAEACNINGDFLAVLKRQLDSLMQEDDYLSLSDVDDYFYETLPKLPAGVFWTAHMLKSVLSFYDVGYKTIPAGEENDMKIPDAAIIRTNSAYSTFADVLWSEINKDYTLPKEFTTEEFREIMLRKGFIHGMEKMYSAHKTVEGDLRFLWSDNNKKVTISSK